MSRHGAGGALAAAVTALGVRAGLGRLVGTDERWHRVNHRGDPVSLLAGPAAAGGLVVGSLVAGGREGRAAALASGGAAAFGLVDDLAEGAERRRKGLRGHLGALAHGELTTGGLKVLGIGAVSVAAAGVLHGPPSRRPTLRGWAADVLLSGALVASSANLVNLLDLRPGRAGKAAGLLAMPALAARSATAPVVLATTAALLPADLDERDMLGDGGANALGAALGTAAAATLPRAPRVALLTAVVGLTVLSERVSFTEVIARTPALRAVDEWGRR